LLPKLREIEVVEDIHLTAAIKGRRKFDWAFRQFGMAIFSGGSNPVTCVR
jgi:hypothetical protein